MINDKLALKNLLKIERNPVDSIYFRTHNKWEGIFKRQAKLTKKSLNYFLDQSKEVAWGIGVSQRNQNEEIENLKFLFEIQNSSNKSFEKYLSKIECENVFGEIPIEFCEFNLTRSNLMNAESTFYLSEYLSSIKNHKSLKILEIGSGYGEFCRQLIKYSNLDIRSYHLVDLPKNLLFAEKYLTTVLKNHAGFKTKVSNFAQEGEGVEIEFYLPSDIESLDNYDLIINTYSLQEMNADTSAAYFKFIADHLNPNGFFYSINSPLKWDILSYNSYNSLKNLENLNSVMHRQLPPSIDGTVPILNIFKKNAGFEYNHEGLEMISKLQAKGFSNLLNDIFENFNLASFSLTDTESLIEKNVFSNIEIKEINLWNNDEIFSYFYNLLVLNVVYDLNKANSVLEYFLKEKNKTVSLCLLYNFSKFLNKKLNLEQIKTFLN